MEALSVLKRQDVLLLSVVRRLRGTPNERGAEKIVMKMKAVGIARQVSKLVGFEKSVGIRLHDNVHAYATALAEKNNETVLWYERIVRSFETNLALPNDNSDGLWPTLHDDDDYIFENFCRLLLGCGKFNLLGNTLRSGRWVAKMMAMNRFLQLQLDVDAYL